jgi:hypothetical protein
MAAAGEPPKARRQVVVFANPEKQGHKKSQDPYIPATPFRMVLAGPPGAGKRSTFLNILANLEEAPSRIIAIHGDPDTKEYEGVVTEDVRGVDGIPDIDEMIGKEGTDRDKHKLVIIDEIPWSKLPKETMSKFERLFNHVSTHASTSIVLMFQQLVAIPNSVRRAADHFILFKNIDTQAAGDLAMRVGLGREAIQEIMGSRSKGNAKTGIVRDKHDSLWLDTTASPEDPWRMRLNLWTPILPRVD